jgi:hypothetical protein
MSVSLFTCFSPYVRIVTQHTHFDQLEEKASFWKSKTSPF